MQDIRFRPLGIDDLLQIGEWLRKEHVARWWSGPASDAAIAEKYLPCIEDSSSVSVFLILYADVPIGMIQASKRPGDPGDYGIDLLIGRNDLTGRGLGPSVIEAFVAGYIFGQCGATSCKADPEIANTRSKKAFSKAGVVSMGAFIEDGQERVLMVRENSN